MKKMPLLLFIIATVMIIPMTGCDSDDENNPEFIEYTNPMANNPVNTISWLIAKKEEAKKWFYMIDPEFGGLPSNKASSDITLGAYVKLYTYQDQDCYEVRYGGLEVKNGLKFNILNFQSDVYNSQGKLCVSIIGGDAVGTQPGYEHFSNFWETATFKSLLWEYKTNN